MTGETTRLLHGILEQLVSNQNAANLKLWDAVTRSFENPKGSERPFGRGMCRPGRPAAPVVKVQKMMPDDDPEAFLNTFECTPTATGWAQDQWAAVLIPCLIGPAQQAVDTLSPTNLTDYARVRAAILQTLNLSPKAY